MGRIEGGGGAGSSIGVDVTLPNDRGIAIKAGATWNQTTYIGTLSGGTFIDGDPIWCLAFWLSSDGSDMAEVITGINKPMVISREFNTMDMTAPGEGINSRRPGYSIELGVITSTFNVTNFVFGDLTISDAVSHENIIDVARNLPLVLAGSDMSIGALISGELPFVSSIYGAAITVRTTSGGGTTAIDDINSSFVKDISTRSFIRVVS